MWGRATVCSRSLLRPDPARLGHRSDATPAERPSGMWGIESAPLTLPDLGDRTLRRPRYRSEHGQREPPRQVPTKRFGTAHFDFTRAKYIGPP
jgi:hypothetical protein